MAGRRSAHSLTSPESSPGRPARTCSPARGPGDQRPAGATASGLVLEASGHVWHTLSADRALRAQSVDGQLGLSAAEVISRAQRSGPNKFTEGKTEPRWRAFIRQYADPMQIVLLVVGIVSLYPLKELVTGLVLIFLTLFNAVLGLHQEGKAAAAVAALQTMMIVKAKVMRDGELEQMIVVSEVRKAIPRRAAAGGRPGGAVPAAPAAAPLNSDESPSEG